MRAIAKYSFTGDPTLSQLSFPIGAKINAKSKSENHGWMWGHFDDHHGWFPVAYVEFVKEELHTFRMDSRSKSRSIGTSANQDIFTIPPVESPLRSTMNATPPPLSSISFEAPVTPSRVINSQDVDEDDGDSMLMGGEPGGLFDLPVSPIYPTSISSRDAASPPILYPTDVYSQAPIAKPGSYVTSTDAAIYVTDKVVSEPPPPTRAETSPPAAQKQPAEDFWNTHPPRAPGPSKVEQSVAIDRAFDALKDDENIKIINEPKKRRFGFPKKLKKIAASTFGGSKHQ
jgi:hypothetical protein